MLLSVELSREFTRGHYNIQESRMDIQQAKQNGKHSSVVEMTSELHFNIVAEHGQFSIVSTMLVFSKLLLNLS